MIVKLAWRNVWRNKTRSLVVIFALATGLFGAMFMAGLANGMVDKWIKTSIENEVSDLQLHNAEYLIMEDISGVMDAKAINKILDPNSKIKSYSMRIKGEGMAQTATNSYQVTIFGINPQAERRVTGIHTTMIEGEYFGLDSKIKPIVIGNKLAEQLKAGLKSKIIFNLADANGNITYENFKVVGLFKTSNSPFDKSTVFVRVDDLREIFKLPPNSFHEVAIRVHDEAETFALASELNSQLNSIKVQTWKDLNPALELYRSSMSLFNIILIAIILVALIFGIINTMLMVIMERTKEIGMLRALGLNNKKVAVMIVLETVFLSMVGGITGNILGYITISITNKTGLHFTSFTEGFEQYGLSSSIYPTLSTSFYILLTVLVVITAVIASVFPVGRALKMDPALSLRD